MHRVFWSLLADPYTGEDLVFEGSVEGDYWVNGILRSSHSTYPVIDGVAVFTKDVDTGWRNEDIEYLRSRRIIEANWEDHMRKAKERGLWSTFCSEIANGGGLVLDIASGPGGGMVPCILYYNADTCVMMNDLEYRILLEWRRFLRGIGRGKCIGFLAADARRLPLKSGSFDIVVSAGGFSNIAGHAEAVREAFRVLKPGGLLYLVEGGVLREDFDKLPARVREKWLAMFPALLGEWARLLEGIGFKVVFHETVGLGTISPNESELGREAHQHGVTLRYVGYYIKAVKQDDRPP